MTILLKKAAMNLRGTTRPKRPKFLATSQYTWYSTNVIQTILLRIYLDNTWTNTFWWRAGNLLKVAGIMEQRQHTAQFLFLSTTWSAAVCL